MDRPFRLGAVSLLVLFALCSGCALQALSQDTALPDVPPEAPPAPARDRTVGDLAGAAANDPSQPSSPVKLIFVHHSTGGHWLADPNGDGPYGGLGIALRNSNYYVSATNYGWGPEGVGSRTDIPNWPEWFTGSNSAAITQALYDESGQNVGDYGSWSRLAADPGGENEIILFKSCFPNSDLYGSPGDPPLSEPNEQMTVANAKAVYNDLLTYLSTRQDKLFVVITAPPMGQGAYADDPYGTPAQRSANARAFNDWLVEDWLSGYGQHNVAVFDYYNVLTSNGTAGRVDDPASSEDPNDLGAPYGNHHRWTGTSVEHMQTVSNNYSAYPTDTSGDSHPTTNGHLKATAEFVPLLNVFYNRWQSGGTPAPTLSLTSPQAGARWPVGSERQIGWTTTGAVAEVDLSYSTDGFGTSQPIASGIANAGAYAWTTPLTPTSSAQVRVQSVISPATVYDVSGLFTLYVPGEEQYVRLPIALRDYTSPAPPPPPGDRISPGDLTYLGAFRLPDTVDELGWTWSGHALAYYPDGDAQGGADGYPGSLYGTGNDQRQYVAEIDIPVPVRSASKDLGALNTATTLQEFQDIRGTLYDDIEGFDDFEGAIGKAGLAYLPAQGAQTTGKLHFCWGYHLQYVPRDAPESLHGVPEPSHGWCELDLSSPGSVGAWTIGDYVNWVTNDYLYPIDPAWAAANTPGKPLATGRFRDGGQGGRGPSLFAYGPWGDGNPPGAGAELSTVPLLLYTSIESGDSDTVTGYNHADEWTGGAWLTAGDRSAVILMGTKGTGDAWYGFADGTVWPDDPPFPPVPDPPKDERGWWSEGFVGQLLFYDPADLAAVARGEMEPYEPQPYASLDIDEHLYHVTSTRQWHHVGAAAFDRVNGLLYVLEPLVDEDKSLVHVWSVQ